MRLLLRLVGFLCLAGAFAALIVDGTRSIASGRTAILPLGNTIASVSPDGFQKFHRLVETKLPVLWDPVCVTIFLLPTWIVLGIVGLILLLLARPPRPTIGYVRR